MSKSEFVIANVLPGKLNAMVKNIMSQIGIDDPNEAVRLINSGEWIVSEPICPWYTKEDDENIIYSSLTSDGTTGPEWIVRLEKKGYNLSKWAKDLLNSPDFKPTKNVTTEIAILKGMLFSDEDRITKKIRKEADKRKLTTPNAEIACLIREKFSNKDIEDMGLWWIVVIHEPVKNSDGDPYLLYADRRGGGRWLVAYCDDPDRRWDCGGGFAFTVSQVSSQS